MFNQTTKIVGVGFLLVVATLILFWPTREFDFTNYDDPDYVSENPVVQQGLTKEGAVWAFTTGHIFNWHPVTWISHMLDVEFFGMKPGRHHWTNVVFHALNALLLFLVLQKMSGAFWKSALVAALFAWHPLHVESVAWVCERKDVLSTFFWLLTLLAYAKYAKKPSLNRYIFVALPFAIGLMAKPMLVTLPFVLLLLDAWPLQRSTAKSTVKTKWKKPITPRTWPQLWLEKVPLILISMAASVVTFLVQRSGGAVARTDIFPLTERIGNSLISYCRYLGKTFWPSDLAVFYPYLGWAAWQIVAAFIFLLIVTALVIRLRKTKPFLAVGWFWFLGTAIPVIGLVQVGTQAMADRYTYVPLIGFFIFFVWGAASLFSKTVGQKNGLIGVFIVMLAGCIWVTHQQLKIWRNSETLFTHAIAVTEKNLVARVMLGNALNQNGNYAGARAHYEAALQLRPDFAEVYFNLGNLAVVENQIDDALAHYSTALQHKPNYAHAHVNFAIALGMKRRFAEAIPHYRTALELEPTDISARHYLAMDLMSLKNYAEAIDQLKQAIVLQPQNALLHDALGDAFFFQQNFSEAEIYFRNAIARDATLAETHFKLATILMRRGERSEAVAEYGAALRIRPDYVEAQNALRQLTGSL